MSLTDNSDNLSIGPLFVLTTVPSGAGPLGRGPLAPLVAGKPPTRNGSLRMDSARPPTTVVQPTSTSSVVTQAIAALSNATTRLHPRLFIDQFHDQPHDQPHPDRPCTKENPS